MSCSVGAALYRSPGVHGSETRRGESESADGLVESSDRVLHGALHVQARQRAESCIDDDLGAR